MLHHLVAVDTLPLCTGAKSTFVSYDGSTESLIDHILIPFSCVDFVQSCYIVDDNCVNVSTHRPVVVNLQIKITSDLPIHARAASIKRLNVAQKDLSYFQHILMGRLNSRKDRVLKATSHECIDRLYT